MVYPEARVGRLRIYQPVEPKSPCTKTRGEGRALHQRRNSAWDSPQSGQCVHVPAVTPVCWQVPHGFLMVIAAHSLRLGGLRENE